MKTLLVGKIAVVAVIGIMFLSFIIWKWSIPENEHKEPLWWRGQGGQGGRG